MEKVTSIQVSRQDLLRIWLRQNNLRFQDVADSLGVCMSSISRTLKAETIPSRRHAQLRTLGIPKELLPTPLDITPGPKKGGKRSPIISNNPDLPALPR